MTGRTDDPPRAPGAPQVGPADVLAFLCELALLALLAVAGWRLGASTALGTPLAVVLALALPGVVVMVWGRWLARTAERRLPQPWRLDVQIALFVAAGLLIAGVGLVWWGVGLALVGTTAFALTRDH
jgi:hypothetical protein